MDRRKFVKAAALLPIAGHAARLSAGSAATPPHQEEHESRPAPGDPKWLPERCALTLQRALTGASPQFTEEFLLADVRPDPIRRFTEYSGDTSGRYIGALASVSAAFRAPAPNLESFVAKVIALEKPEGYFGAAFHSSLLGDNDLALLWGNGRLLVGLLEYYAVDPSPRVLAACTRLGDWLVEIGPLMLSKPVRDAFGANHFASSYICWMQQTEGLAILYKVTGDARYRILAEEIAAVIERRPGDHVHGYLTSLRGVVDLYEATRDARFLKQCEVAWDDVERSPDLLLTGGVPEGWSPNNHRTEGCGEADWVRLGLGLYKQTGEAKYLDAAEKAIFNEFAFNQFATGDFGHRRYTETGLPAEGAVRAWWCCTLHGLRAFADIETSVLKFRDGEVFYELPLDGRFASKTIAVTAASRLAQDGTIRLTVAKSAEVPFRLKLRKPGWSDALLVKVNGVAVAPVQRGAYASIERKWNAGDQVEVKYAMQLRAEPAGPNRVAYWYGPWLLGAPAADNPGYFNELTADNKLLRGQELPLSRDKEQAVSGNLAAARRFAVPVAAWQVPFIPAEFPSQPSTVVLRAIAEQTGMATTSWETRFLV
jgi:DUF1680 family protein